MNQEEEKEPSPSQEPAPMSLAEARERLRARGYLDRGFEGTVLKGVVAARTRTRGVVRAAIIASALLALALAVAETVSRAAFSRLGPSGTAILFLWLLLGSGLAALLGVGVLLFAAWSLLRLRRDSDAVPTELGVVFGLLAGLLGATAALPALRQGGAWAAAAILASTGLLVFLAVRIARSLSLTMALTAGKNLLGRHRRTGIISASVLSIGVILAALAAGRPEEPPAAEPLLVRPSKARVQIMGVDGWADQLFDSPVRFPADAVVLSYSKERRDPAAFWTSIVTAETPRKHGIGAIDLVRLRGVSKPVQPGPASALYLTRLLPALGMARRETATSAARRVPAAWEIAQRAGIPSVTVNWWTSYPVSPGGATVLSNHLFFAARDRGSLTGEGWPEADLRAVTEAFRPAPAPARDLERLISEASGIDSFAMAASTYLRGKGSPRLSLVYLPGLDILTTALAEPSRSTEERSALARALITQAERIRTYTVEALAADVDLTILILDGGRQSSSGRVVLAGRLVRAGARGGQVKPEDILPTVLHVLGVPASRAAAGRPITGLLEGPEDVRWVGSWGEPERGKTVELDSREYIENLKSLGYLQ